jgi:hypothetical protein
MIEESLEKSQVRTEVELYFNGAKKRDCGFHKSYSRNRDQLSQNELSTIVRTSQMAIFDTSALF